ncbi:MAG: substrate-binding domain-containing protein [Verrucomicrobiae bacterium]|nr:substrate-binding domain-containing protein [Verrucomicrobiae bacterium]
MKKVETKPSTGLIGVVFPSWDLGFLSEFLRGVDSVGRVHGYHMVTLPSSGSIEPVEISEHLLKKKQVDGLLLFDAVMSHQHLRSLQEFGRPLVLVNRRCKSVKYNSVVINDYRGAYDATRHLIDLGHERIAMLTGPLMYEDARDRLTGYKAALQESGLTVDPDLVLEGTFERESSTILFAKHFRNRDWPDAVFAANDEMGLGILRYCRNHRNRKVREIAVVGFDDIEMSKFVGLTSVHVPFFEIGRRSVTMLVDLLQHPGKRPQESLEELLPVKLVVRASSGENHYRLGSEGEGSKSREE